MRRRFEQIIKAEVNEVWNDKRQKNNKKKQHLENKHKPRKEEKEFRGIPIGDKELGEDVELNEDEKEFLKLPKSATDYVRVDRDKVKTSIQVTAAKLRMSLMEQEGNDSQGMEVPDDELMLAGRRVYDPDEGNVDMSKKKVTDMANCRRITVPDAATVSKESELQVLIDNLEDVLMKAGKEEASCLKAGGVVKSTMTEQQGRGRESLLKREKNGELVLVGSDKSGKLIPMSPGLYRECMEPHVQGDSVHTREEVLEAEKQFNGATRQILRAFKVGEGWGHEARFQMAGRAENNEVPHLNQLVKDHKPTLVTRPVCRAQVQQARNGPLAEVVCEILNPFVEEADRNRRTEVRSTEELCAEMKRVNENIE